MRLPAPLLKESLHHLGTFSCQHSANNLHLVIQLRVVYDLHDGSYRSGLGIICAVNQTRQAGMHQGATTHGAGFNGDKHFASFEAMITEKAASLAQRNNFSVRTGITIHAVAIVSPANNVFLMQNDRSYRDFVVGLSAHGLAQGLFHPQFVRYDHGQWFYLKLSRFEQTQPVTGPPATEA